MTGSQRFLHKNGYEWRLEDGKLHREDGPAVEDDSGYTAWCLNGRLHKEDGPALRDAMGDFVFYIDGHRLDPKIEIYNSDLQAKYPKLIESMIIHLVHES